MTAPATRSLPPTQLAHNAALGNRSAIDGLSLCECGSKYWENDRCVDCSEAHDPARHDEAV